jgi:methylase of polypeptide subunit release factors
MPDLALSGLPGAGADWSAWHELGQTLDAAPGVHRPSEFSSLLASTLEDVGGRSVVDAGSGAGLIAIAALAAGASQVVAMDRDAAALESTATNVTRLLGPAARARLSLWQADFAQLGVLAVDVLAVNPPQRPAGVLGDVEEDQRHLHTGAGDDGLDSHRLVLAHAAAREVRSTAAAALAIDRAALVDGWSPPRRLTAATLPLHPAWGSPDGRGEVGVWAFSRAPGA